MTESTPLRPSAGGIIFGTENKMLLVNQHNNSWSFPKGKVDPGENELKAARREIKEETGVTDLTLVKELGTYERYSIAKDGITERKDWGLRKRTIFLFTTNQSELQLQSLDGEVTDVRWVTIDEALTLLTHPKDKEFLSSVRDKIEQWI